MSTLHGFPMTSVLSRPDSVLFRMASGEAVLLDLTSERYFALEGVGAHFWEFVERGATLGDAVDGLLEHYDVTREVLTADLAALVRELTAAGLLAVTEP